MSKAFAKIKLVAIILLAIVCSCFCAIACSSSLVNDGNTQSDNSDYLTEDDNNDNSNTDDDIEQDDDIMLDVPTDDGDDVTTVPTDDDDVVDEPSVDVVIISEFVIASMPDKVTYYVGEEICYDGLSLKAIYFNNTTIEVSLDDCEIVPCDIENGAMLISINYEEFVASFTITWVEICITSITAVNYDETTYYEGDSVDLSCVEVTAVYNNGESKVLESGYDISIVEIGSIRVAYDEFIAECTYNVIQIFSLSVTCSPCEFVLGDIDLSDYITVYVLYEDMTKKQVTDYYIKLNDEIVTDNIVTGLDVGKYEFYMYYENVFTQFYIEIV